MTYTVKRLSCAKQTETVTSFSGGSPLLSKRFPWPTCGDCGQPLPFCSLGTLEPLSTELEPIPEAVVRFTLRSPETPYSPHAYHHTTSTS